MKYESVEFPGQGPLEEIIARNDPAELLYVPVAAGLHASDLAWAQNVCLRLAAHPHFNVRGNALLGFGHLARRFGRLDRALVEPLVRIGLTDPDNYVRGQAAAAADDLEHFLGWHIAPAV